MTISQERIKYWAERLEGEPSHAGAPRQRLHRKVLEKVVHELAPDLRLHLGNGKGSDVFHKVLKGNRTMAKDRACLPLELYCLDRARKQRADAEESRRKVHENMKPKAPAVENQQLELETPMDQPKEEPKPERAVPSLAIVPKEQIVAMKEQAELKLLQVLCDLEDATGMKAGIDTHEYERSGEIRIGLSLNI